jgi:tetratricopeptide (TPR) repeat protein
MQQYEAALADYGKALAKGPGRWEWWAGRGEVALALKQWDQAVEDFTKATKQEDRRAELYRKLAWAEAERGGWQKANEALTKAIRFGGNEPEVWYEQALTQLAGGDAKGYRQTCERLVKKFSARDDAATRRLIALTCALAPEALGDLKALVERAEKIVRDSPEDALARTRLAGLLLRAGQAERAVLLMEKIASSEQARPSDMWLLVLAYQKAGKADKAKEWQDKAKSAILPEGASWQERQVTATWRKEAEAAGKGGS